jgi:hypothetical protein
VAEFIPGIELARAFYLDVLAGIIGTVPHSSALLGEGSEVLGFDSERSTDHAWGPRAQVFVPPDVVESLRLRIDALLPDAFRGWPVRYYRWQTNRIEHHVEVISLADWLKNHLGFEPRPSPTVSQWLATSQQILLEVTSGLVFCDDSGELARVRAALAWYPDNIWMWMMASAWNRIQDKESFVGRTAELRDELGSRLLATHIAHDVVRLCFLQERQYAPYAKWLGTAFARLNAATDVGPMLNAVLGARSFAHRERALIRLIEAMARRHNALGVTAPLIAETGPFEVGINDAVRPYHVLNAGRFVQACLDSITDESLRRLPVVGAIDQLTDPTDLIRFTEWPQQLATAYGDQLAAKPDRPAQETPES